MPSGIAGFRSFPPSPPGKAGHIGGLWFANAIWYYRYHQPLAEPHFKATSWVIGELLKLNIAFPLKYKVFNKYNTSTIKEDSELPCLGQQDWNNNILLLNEKKEKRNNSGKSH